MLEIVEINARNQVTRHILGALKPKEFFLEESQVEVGEMPLVKFAAGMHEIEMDMIGKRHLHAVDTETRSQKREIECLAVIGKNRTGTLKVRCEHGRLRGDVKI